MRGVRLLYLGLLPVLDISRLVVSPSRFSELTAGGLEPPRQLASGCQDRHVCQFHHAVNSENLEGENLPAKTPSESPYSRYPLLGGVREPTTLEKNRIGY